MRTNINPAHIRAQADELLAAKAPLWGRLPRRVLRGEQAVHPIRAHGHVRGSRSPADLEHAAATRAQLAAGLRAVRGRVLDGHAISREPLDEIVDTLIDLATRHADSLPAMAFADNAAQADPATEHAVATAALAVAAAVELGWSRCDVRDAALVALLANFGMATLPFDPYATPRPLTEIEQARVRPHGDLSAALASRIEAIPDRVLLAITQHHERPDGRGTPRALKPPVIHDLALLVGACDVLAAIAAPRAHRPAMLPHAALMQTAQLSREGAVDEEMCSALIRACGKFPPGSHVRLSTGDIGVVVSRPAKADAHRPVVRIMPFWGAASFAAIGKPVTVDLADEALTSVSVVAAIEVAEAAE